MRPPKGASVCSPVKTDRPSIETVDDIEAEIAAAIQIFDEMLADAQAAATVFDAHHVAPQIAGSEPVKFLSAAFAEIGRIEQGGAER